MQVNVWIVVGLIVIAHWIGFAVGCAWMRLRDVGIINRWADGLDEKEGE